MNQLVILSVLWVEAESMCYTFNEESDKASEGLLRSGLYVNLQSDEAIEMDLVYLTYRAERDLYDWRQAADPNSFWVT